MDQSSLAAGRRALSCHTTTVSIAYNPIRFQETALGVAPDALPQLGPKAATAIILPRPALNQRQDKCRLVHCGATAAKAVPKIYVFVIYAAVVQRPDAASYLSAGSGEPSSKMHCRIIGADTSVSSHPRPPQANMHPDLVRKQPVSETSRRSSSPARERPQARPHAEIGHALPAL
jgi:hypothetical protein